MPQTWSFSSRHIGSLLAQSLTSVAGADIDSGYMGSTEPASLWKNSTHWLVYLDTDADSEPREPTSKPPPPSSSWAPWTCKWHSWRDFCREASPHSHLPPQPLTAGSFGLSLPASREALRNCKCPWQNNTSGFYGRLKRSFLSILSFYWGGDCRTLRIQITGGSHHPRPPCLWLQLQVRGVPKPPSDLIICCKDSQNSVKAIILMVIADYGERIQVGYNSQGKRLGERGSPGCYKCKVSAVLFPQCQDTSVSWYR